MLRKSLIAVGILLVVLVGAAVALLTLLDVNRFKPRIEQFVQDRYQRSLRMDGDLSLSLFPRIALTLPPSTLSEHGGQGEAASIAGARVSVEVMPLLRGQIVADKVMLDGLKATVERRADGSLSVDDLWRPARPDRGQDAAAVPVLPSTSSSPPAPPAPSTPGGSPSNLPRFDIGGLGVTAGQVVFRDQQAGNTLTVSGIALDAGRIANQSNTPLSLRLDFSSTQPEASGRLDLKADAQMDLDRSVFGARRLEATLSAVSGTTRLDKLRVGLASLSFDPATLATDLQGLDANAGGTLDSAPFEASLSAPRLALTENATAGEPLQASIRLAGDRTMEARIEASGLGGSVAALTVSKLSIDAATRQGPRAIQAKLATPAKANLPAGVYEFPALAGTVQIDDPELVGKTATIELNGSASADTLKEVIDARLQAKAQEMTLVAEVDVSGFSRPKVGFDLTADQLDVDRYFPPGPAAAAVTGPAGAGGAPGGGGAGADEQIDLSALLDLDLQGKVSVGRLQVRGIRSSDLQATLKAATGRLDVAPVNASLYGGRLTATAVVLAGATPAANRFDITADLAGVSIGPLLKDVADKDVLEGRGNLKMALATGGGKVDTLKRELDGTVALRLRDGAIKGINLGETIRSTRSLLQGGGSAETKASDASQKTDFTELSVSFVITDGIASSNDLDVRSPLIRLAGAGRADLVASRLDYTVRTSVVGTSTGQGGKGLEDLRGVTIPVRLAGPFDKLDWQIDWETAGKEALKSRASAELKRRLKTDDIEGKAKEQLGEALKGLFNR